jgi:hypothetical protein
MKFMELQCKRHIYSIGLTTPILLDQVLSEYVSRYSNRLE